jgi:ABC-type phosphate/phosphonate transport system permease subunit
MLYGSLLLAMAVASISMTVTKSSLFNGFREKTNKIGKFFRELFNCPYCLSHWLAILGVLTFFGKTRTLPDLVLMTFSTVTFACFAMAGISYLFLLLNTLDE